MPPRLIGKRVKAVNPPEENNQRLVHRVSRVRLVHRFKLETSDFSDDTLRQLPLIMPIGEILQSSEPVLNRVLAEMITAYETDGLDDFRLKLGLELRVIAKEVENLNNRVFKKLIY